MYTHIYINNKNMTKPLNAGQSWPKGSEHKLLSQIKDGMSYSDIALYHKRTERGVRCRIKLIANDMYSWCIPIDKIIESTGLTKKEILRRCNKRAKSEINDELKLGDKMIFSVIGNHQSLSSISSDSSSYVTPDSYSTCDEVGTDWIYI